MNEGGSRRAVAEIRFGEERIGITKVGGRSIHQYWTLLGPHFRDVLLAPQRRSDDGGVAWTWREAADKKPLTVAELAAVRKRLERAKESFEENPVSPLMGEGRTGTSSQALVDQVAAKVKAMAESLTAKPDAVLANFVCRTETGVMVHSWGVASAAPVIYPDSLETGVSGVVLAAGKPAENYEVVIENAKGLSVARMQSDEVGEFHFSKIGPGRYRVRVVAGKVKFPAKGVMVTVERGAVSRLELQSTATSNEQGEGATTPPASASTEALPDAIETTSPQQPGERGWLSKAGGVVLVLLLLGGGGVWAWRTWSTPDETDKRVAVQSSSMAPEDFSTGQNAADKARPSNLAADDGAGLGASADGVGGVARRPAPHSGATVARPTTAVATAARHSPSTIGSKVDVLSGVAEEPGADGKGAGDSEAQPTALVGTEDPGSVPEQASAVADTGARNRTTTTSRPKDHGKGAIAPSISGRLTKGDGAQQAGEAEAVEVENTKPMTGVKSSVGSVRITAAKKAAARQTQGAVSVGERPADGEGENNEFSTPEETSAEAPQDEVTVQKPEGGLPPENGPTSKVSVVNKGLAVGRARATGDTPGSESAAAAGNDAPTLSGTTKKRGTSTPGSGAKAIPGGASAAAEAPAGTSHEPNDMAPIAPVETQNSASIPANSTTGNSGDASPDHGPDGTGAKSADPVGNGGTAAGHGKPGVARISPTRPQSALKSKPIANGPRSLPNETREEGSPDDSKADLSDATKARVGNTGGGLETDAKPMAAEVQFTRWELRLLVDAIVPTLPACVGVDDVANQMRDGMLSEQKARVPVTFRKPAVQRGFVFKLPETPSARAFYWQDSPVGGTAIKKAGGGHAEIVWVGEDPPRSSVQVLKFSDGREAVRLAVNEKGGMMLMVARGVLCSQFLVVKSSVVDESGLGKSEPGARFSWQVNGEVQAALKQAVEPAAGNQDQSLNLPLDLSKRNELEIALADRITGWALVTKIQLQPMP